MSAKSSAGQSLSSVEAFFWKFVADIVGQKNVDLYTQEKYQPFWKYGSIAVVMLMLLFGAFGPLISSLVGFGYPAYCSIRALESPDKKDDTRWLTYWVVFAAFSVLDNFADVLLGWIPFYWLAKVLFLGWCFAPGDFNGSTVVYQQIILPFFMKHEKEVKKVMDKVDDAVTKTAETAASIANTGDILL